MATEYLLGNKYTFLYLQHFSYYVGVKPVPCRILSLEFKILFDEWVSVNSDTSVRHLMNAILYLFSIIQYLEPWVRGEIKR